MAENVPPPAAAAAAAIDNFVGFGTAGLGGHTYEAVTHALEEGFRKFDTAEAEYWYDQKTVGDAIRNYYFDFVEQREVCEEDVVDTKKKEDDEESSICSTVYTSCQEFGLEISTKIPPWQLTSISNIRKQAYESRRTLVGFCQDNNGHYPLDMYYIHAPKCWKGWHPRCDNDVSNLISLEEAWLGMEAVVGIDGNAKRIGLSNVHPNELQHIISFVQQRRQQQEQQEDDASSSLAPPRMPDVVQAYADPLYSNKELRQLCKDHGISFVSYSTLGTQHVMKNNNNNNPVLTNPTIQAIAQSHSRSVAEVVLSWALSRDMSVIPRSRNPHHIRELSNMLPSSSSPQQSLFLTDQELLQIDQLEYN